MLLQAEGLRMGNTGRGVVLSLTGTKGTGHFGSSGRNFLMEHKCSLL